MDVHWNHDFCLPENVVACGGKRSATQLLHAQGKLLTRTRFARSKAPSSLHYAGAVQNLANSRIAPCRRSALQLAEDNARHVIAKTRLDAL